MIIDKIKNASTHFGLGERFAKALLYLQSTDFKHIEPGKYEIEGDGIYALVQQYMTSEKKDRLEAHRRYADIHYMVDGVEVMGVANTDDLEAGTYDNATDYLPVQGTVAFITIPACSFIIIHPQDAHMPGLILDTSQMVKKVVMKVLLEQ